MQAQHKQIALVSLYTFHDRLHFVPFNKFRRQTYTLHLGGLPGTGAARSYDIVVSAPGSAGYTPPSTTGPYVTACTAG